MEMGRESEKDRGLTHSMTHGHSSSVNMTPPGEQNSSRGFHRKFSVCAST